MSKIIVRRQEYANNGTHANEIEAVVQQNLIANTLSSATDIAASVGLVKSETDAIKESLSTTEFGVIATYSYGTLSYVYNAAVKQASIRWAGNATQPDAAQWNVATPDKLKPRAGLNPIAPQVGKYGGHMEVTPNYINISLDSTKPAWSSAYLMYFTV